MTRTVDLDETEYAGAMKVRFYDVDITSYEQGGESFTPADVGMARFQKVHADEAEATSVRAKYVPSMNSIYLYDGGTEAAGGATATVRVMVVGR